ncbi:hypothetical protein HanIR_Chr10g0485331 [Helianthus annuus]|nr:hypothetical protein HanIR_Chr10g0485331 [Helianthus annuus]
MPTADTDVSSLSILRFFNRKVDFDIFLKKLMNNDDVSLAINKLTNSLLYFNNNDKVVNTRVRI